MQRSMGGNARHAGKNALIGQRGQQAAGKGAVAVAVDGDEIRGRGQRRQAVIPGYRADAGTGGGDLGQDMGQPVAVLQGGKRPDLRDAVVRNGCGCGRTGAISSAGPMA